MVVEFLFNIEGSFIGGQYAFNQKFQLKQHDIVPSHLTASQWLTNFHDYKESNKPNLKFLAYIGSKKSLVELGVPKNELFNFFHIF